MDKNHDLKMLVLALRWQNDDLRKALSAIIEALETGSEFDKNEIGEARKLLALTA